MLADCPAGYTIKNDQFRSCYMLTSRKLTWFEAELFCQSTRGHLVALETEEEAEYVVQQIRSSRGKSVQNLRACELVFSQSHLVATFPFPHMTPPDATRQTGHTTHQDACLLVAPLSQVCLLSELQADLGVSPTRNLSLRDILFSFNRNAGGARLDGWQ